MDDGATRFLATISDFQHTFNSPHGEKVLRHLMHVCGMMSPSMDMRECNPYGMAFNEGRRSVVIEILQKIRVDLMALEKEIRKQPEGESDVII